VSGAGLSTGAVTALDALDDLARRLVGVRTLLTGPDAAVRLVTTPERVVLAETMRSRTTLAMLGHHVDGVVVNRAAVGEEWPPGVAARHRAGLVAARDLFGDLPVRVAPHTDDEPVGVAALLALADALVVGGDPLDLGARRAEDAVHTDGRGWFLDVSVPGAGPEDVDVSVTDDGDLVVDLGPHRRVIALPAVLRRCDVAGASLDLTDHGQVVRVRFDPDLERWSTAVAR
jgi:arsenite-transporting ATPase